MDFFG